MAEDNRDEPSNIMSELEIPSHKSQVTSHADAEMKLNALMQITRALSESVQRSEVFSKILDCLFDLFESADRGFIILKNERGELRTSATRTRNINKERLRISKTIVEKVLKSKRPLISSDAASDEQFDVSQSIVDFRIRSIMCAPLINNDDEAIGVIQLDTIKNRVAFDEKDLEVLVAVAMQASLGIQKLNLVDEAVENRRIADDLKLAHEVQQAFLPQKRPNFADFSFYSFYRATNQVGGDYFDYIPIDENRMAIIVADVVGHGIAAALLMAKVAAEVRSALAATRSVEDAIHHINENLSGLNVDRFATVLLGILDAEASSFTYVNAGHIPPVIRDCTGEVRLLEGNSGMPIGIMDDTRYEANCYEIQGGETITLFTDGINESMNEAGEMLGLQNLLEAIKVSQTKTPATIGREICQIANRHMGSTPPIDDMCLVCFGRGCSK